jgi:hypothetical protein
MYDVEGEHSFLPNIVAITSPPSSSDLEQDIAVMHPDYPCAEPTTFRDGRKDQWTASVYQDHMGVNRLRPLSSDELITAYSIPGNLQNAYDCSTVDLRNVNLRATACVPWLMAEILIEPALNFLLCSRHDPGDTHPMSRTVSTLVSVGMPSINEWAAAYQAKADCKAIIAKFPKPWNAKEVKGVNSCYRQPLLQGAIEWVNGRICISHLVDRHSRLLLLIIVPAALRRTMFVAYHAAPTCGHMGRYKTLFRLRQQFFWPSMRKQVDEMVAACPHCALANSRKQVKSELMFGWPLDSPFCTLHVDLWSAGDANGDGNQEHLLNSMCDMTQFVVSTPSPVILASALASLFMQEVLL